MVQCFHVHFVPSPGTTSPAPAARKWTSSRPGAISPLRWARPGAPVQPGRVGTWDPENHGKTMGKPWEKHERMGINTKELEFNMTFH